jgi:hypothetical protein
MATMRIYEVLGSKFNSHRRLLKWWVLHKNEIWEDDEEDDDVGDDEDDDNQLTNECPEL